MGDVDGLSEAERILLELVEASTTVRDGQAVPTWTVRYDAFQAAREYLTRKGIPWAPRK